MNNQRFTLNLVMIIAMLIGTIPAIGQDTWEETGEIEDTQVVIEKDRKIELPKANRTYQKVPPQTEQVKVAPLEYQFGAHEYDGGPYTPQLRYKPLPGSTTTTKDNGYAKLGFGNYLSPLGELAVNTVNQSLSAGLVFKHLSFARGPVGGSNSASSDSDANLYLRSAGKKNTVSLDLDFGSSKRNHYGYSQGLGSEIDPTEQRYNRFGVNLSLASTDDDLPIDYNVTAGFYTLDDKFTAGESGFVGDIGLSTPLTESITLFTDIDLLFTEYREVVDSKRNLTRIKGGVLYDWGSLNLTAAANITLNNDTIGNANDFKVYPYLKANYRLTDQWKVSAGLSGDLEAVTLRSIVDENPFIARNVALYHSNKQVEVYGEVVGELSTALQVKAGVSFTDYENLYFNTDTLRFDLTYDLDTKVFSPYAEINYQHENGLVVQTRFDYLHYNTSNLAEPWHRPNFVSKITAKYPVNEKINTGATLSILSGIKAFDPAIGDATNLDTIYDLGIDGQYMVNDKISGFVELNNILGKKYQRFIYYPNRSVMVHLGVIYSF